MRLIKKTFMTVVLSAVMLGGMSLLSGCSSDEATPANLNGKWELKSGNVAISYQYNQTVYGDDPTKADAALAKLKTFVTDIQKNLSKVKAINITLPSTVSISYEDGTSELGTIVVNDVSDSYKTFKITSMDSNLIIEGEANATTMLIYYGKTYILPILHTSLSEEEYTYFDSLFQAIIGVAEFAKTS